MKVGKLLLLIVIAVLLVSTSSVPISKAEGGTYRDYDTFMKAFTDLAKQYPSMISYQSVGKTVENRNIIMFMIGNPDGGRIFLDGAIHGEESLAGEILYSYAKWLVTSNAPLANEILAGTCTLIVPAVNADEYNIVRTNANHVDLNRNFATNWQHGGSSDPDSWYYRGPSPLSEPESQTITRIFQTYKPRFYVNVHRGGSVLYENHYGNGAYYALLSGKMTDLANSLKVTPYPHTTLSGPGFAMTDAAVRGITSYLFEVMDWTTNPSLSQIDSLLLPRFISVAAVLSQECENQGSLSERADINQDGTVDIYDALAFAAACFSTPNSPNWNVAADINCDGAVDLFDAIILAYELK
jgi:hypothetical protein